ncbi:kinesin-like protein KIF20B [Drosophila gunungcola]|uniref:CCDC113/CCDC96 coiled-coil domain-containing protein n=1 Tax=Drosophila gunungcola TaxID=103775 RepID=A0A9P9YT79_9MUSC|nr:kinesin-like protein KIF20B [Drosophila gunungcola]XP_052852502.1 kinesin-like protein KIF20B [Drosophila gunungcola]XP_052852503.1 kinesin-like protein KIF20B [Drosophila gunungcola]KAI8042323.1 hypothetical protein M5D96_003626 [Drosophila gunungcola]
MSIPLRASFMQASQSTGNSISSEPRSRISSTVSIGNEIIIKKKKKTEETKMVSKVARDIRTSKKKAESVKATTSTILKEEKSRASFREASRGSSEKFTSHGRLSRTMLLDSSSDRASLNSMASTTSASPSISSRRSNRRNKKSESLISMAGDSRDRHHIHLLRAVKPNAADQENKVQAESIDTSETDIDQLQYLKSSDTNSIEIRSLSDNDSKKVLTSLLTVLESDQESSVTEMDSRVEEPDHDDQAGRISFLSAFDKLPDIDTLSATASTDIIYINPEEEKVFVAAVDEGSQEPSKSETSTDFNEENENIDNLELKTISSTFSSATPIESDGEIEKDDVPDEASIEDIRECLLSIKPRATAFDDISGNTKYQARLANSEMVEQFLDGLLNEAVQFAEGTAVRRARLLDKVKMLEELDQMAIVYQYEKQQNQFLEKLTTEYYVRHKEFVQVSEPRQVDTINRERFMTALMQLDTRLEEKSETEKVSLKRICDLRKEESLVRKLDAEKISHFEDKVRKSLCKEGCGHLRNVVDDLLRKMNKIRAEMSDAREELIFVQHRLHSIKNKSEKMESLGNGLQVVEYISNQAHNNALGIKIEEKDLELKRLRDRTVHSIHAMAHLTNKKQTNKELLEDMKSRLRTQEQRRKDLRDRLHAEMVQHKRLKKQAKKLRNAGCLMHYPDMLRDYDATMTLLETKRVVVGKLRLERSRLERRNSELEVIVDRSMSSLRTQLRSLRPASKRLV